MGGVVSAVKTVVRTVVNVSKSIWNGIKYIAKKVYNAAKYVAKKAVQMVKTFIGKVVVMVEVAVALVAGVVIGHVLESFSLGLLAGVSIFLGFFLASVLIFGSFHQQDEDLDKNTNRKESDQQSNPNISAPSSNNGPDFDKDNEKEYDHKKILLENVKSYIQDCSKYQEENNYPKKHRIYHFNKDGSIIDTKDKENAQEKDEDDDDSDSDSDDFEENKNIIDYELTSQVFFSCNKYAYYLKFKNFAENEEILETNMNKILECLISSFKSYDIEFETSENKNEDNTTKTIIIHKNSV